MEKQALSLLISMFLHEIPHRMNIRCFLTGFFGQEDTPSGKEKGDLDYGG